MKIATLILFCLCALAGRAGDALRPEELADAEKEAELVRPVDLQMEIPGLPGRVAMSNQHHLYIVSVGVGGGNSFTNYPRPDPKDFGLQVWLLKTDGTAVPQPEKPTFIGVGNAGWDEYSMIYCFDKVPSNELAGVVVQVKGRLYCHNFTTNMIGPAQSPLNAVCGRWQSEAGESYQFDSDGNYEHWQQTPPVSKLAQAEDVDGSARKDLSKGRFTVDHDWLVLMGTDGAATRTNSYYVIADRTPNDKGKFFENDLSLVIRQPDKSEKSYELMYR